MRLASQRAADANKMDERILLTEIGTLTGVIAGIEQGARPRAFDSSIAEIVPQWIDFLRRDIRPTVQIIAVVEQACRANKTRWLRCCRAARLAKTLQGNSMERRQHPRHRFRYANAAEDEIIAPALGVIPRARTPILIRLCADAIVAEDHCRPPSETWRTCRASWPWRRRARCRSGTPLPLQRIVWFQPARSAGGGLRYRRACTPSAPAKSWPQEISLEGKMAEVKRPPVGRQRGERAGDPRRQFGPGLPNEEHAQRPRSHFQSAHQRREWNT